MFNPIPIIRNKFSEFIKSRKFKKELIKLYSQSKYYENYTKMSEKEVLNALKPAITEYDICMNNYYFNKSEQNKKLYLLSVIGLMVLMNVNIDDVCSVKKNIVLMTDKDFDEFASESAVPIPSDLIILFFYLL